jgi:DegV family protein with EDD domain
MHISNKLSGTWQNSLNAARKVAEQTGKKIEVVDSRRLTSGMGLLLLRAAEALEKGLTHEELVAEIPHWIENSRILVTTRTLKYMVKSGRVSNTKGFIGNLLNLKPVVDVASDGTIKSFGKPFTLKQSMKLVMKEVKTQFGYHIIVVDEIKEGRQQTFDEVKGKLGEKMKAERKNKYFNDYIAGLKKQMQVKTYPNLLDQK